MTEDEIRDLIPESYGEIRFEGRHDRRLELRSTTRDIGEGPTARLFMDYGHRRGNFPLDAASARELVEILQKFITIADLIERRRKAEQPGAFAEFDKLLGIESDD